ncbi:phage Gp37/Gp68 family protein, partial [Brevibacillus borstelensis]|uniref:phage Gp37/Gp68 family protein n=1 Tax=Brevibacillus borstelensis TaxID=45462 RepID=UPI0004F2F0C4
MTTAIEWTDTVWNPVTGCSKVSEGCRNCYAFALHDMRHKAFREGKKLPQQYAKPFNEIQLFSVRLEQPLKWRKPRRIFVNSMADLFHDDVPFDFIDQVFAVMALCQQHTFQILTKRPKRMLEYFAVNETRWDKLADIAPYMEQWGWISPEDAANIAPPGSTLPKWPRWPLPNVWLGTSVENQKEADERIPLLLETPAAVRFLSCEPLLGPVDLEFTAQYEHPDNEGYGVTAIKGLDWVIVGGESGPNARPMHPDWAEHLRDQCEEYGVPFFFKQWGEWAPVHELRCNEPGIKGKPWYNFDPDTALCRIGKERAGRVLDGQEWNEFPGGERDAR